MNHLTLACVKWRSQHLLQQCLRLEQSHLLRTFEHDFVKDDALAVYRYSSIFTLYVTNLIESIIWSFCGGLFGCLKVKSLWVSGFLIFLSRLVSGCCVPIRRFLKLLSNVPGAELEIDHCSKIVIIKSIIWLRHFYFCNWSIYGQKKRKRFLWTLIVCRSKCVNLLRQKHHPLKKVAVVFQLVNPLQNRWSDSYFFRGDTWKF